MKLGALVAKLIADNLLAITDRLEKRIEERLDARLKALPIPVMRGSWGPDVEFEANDVVRLDHALWQARKAACGVRPGTVEGQEYWRLFVRAGPKSIAFSLDPKSCVLSVKMGDEPALALGSIKPALYEALIACGVLTVEQAKALEAKP